MINEAKKSKPIVVTIGRFQPMTAGHELLMNKVMDTARKHGAEYRVYTTFTKGDSSNPLTHAEKVRFMRKQIPGLKVSTDKTVRNPYDLMEALSKEGWKEVYLVLGGSRVSELKRGISRYIPSKYKFEKFTVVSAGKRDPDAEGLSGVSGTKVREMVRKGHKAKFRKTMPSTCSKKVADDLYTLLRKKMGLKEEVELQEAMTVAQKRKRSIIFKRLAKRIQQKKRMKRKRRRSTDELRARAHKAAKRAFRNRLLKGKNYYELSFSERIRVDNRLSKIKKNRIETLAKKLFPQVVRAERERQQRATQSEARDYGDEYKKYHSSPQYRADRAARVQARRDAEAEGRVSKGDGKDVHHIDGNARNNSKGNTRVMSSGKNRGQDNNSKKYTRKEEHGAGEEGTKKLVNKYKKETPGQTVKEVYRKSGLGKWFHGQSAGGEPGWDRYNTKGERIGKCGDSKPGEGKPKCLSRQKAAKLRAQGGKKAIGNAVRRKRAKDPDQDRPGTGNKPINVSNRIDKDPKKKGIQDMKSFDEFKDQIREASMADRKVVRQRNPRSLEKKTTNVSLVLPNTPEMKKKMSRVLGKDKGTRGTMNRLVTNRETRKDGSIVLYFNSTRGRKKFQTMMNESKSREFSMTPSPAIKNAIESGKAKIVNSAQSHLGGNSVFAVLENPFAKGRTSQDQFIMAIISNPKRPGSLKLFSYFGSHPSATGAMKFGKNRGLITKRGGVGEQVEIDEVLGTLKKVMKVVKEPVPKSVHNPDRPTKKSKGDLEAEKRQRDRKLGLESVKVGDTVHLGHGTKGGTGVKGKVHKIDGKMVHIKNEKGDTFKGPMDRVSTTESYGELTPAQNRDAERRLKPTRATVAKVRLPASDAQVADKVKQYQSQRGGKKGNTRLRRLRDLRLKLEGKHHTYHVSNIDYETDGDHKAKRRLPKSMKVKVPDHVHKGGEDDIKDHIDDHISNETGYLHNGYKSKKIKESVELEEAKAKDIVKGLTDMDGPFTVVAIKNNKVIKQEGTKMRNMLPAIVKMMRKEVGRGVTIGIEDKKGTIRNTFKEGVELDEVLDTPDKAYKYMAASGREQRKREDEHGKMHDKYRKGEVSRAELQQSGKDMVRKNRKAQSGRQRAYRKTYAKGTAMNPRKSNESVQVDELKSSTYRSYISKATKDNQDRVVRMVGDNRPTKKRDMRKLRKRSKGVDRARTTLARREADAAIDYENTFDAMDPRVVGEESKKVVAPKGFHWMKKGTNEYKLMKDPDGGFKPHKGASTEADFEVQTVHNEDWQKVNRKDKTDGLSQKAVDAYRRENPGSKLQTAVTEKKPKGKRAARRKSFCRRMKGMKAKLTSAETRNDPDSRINKALRRWRC